MAKIVNLGRARKDRARAEKRRKADANAAFHGLSKMQKDAAKREADKARREVDGHRRDGPDDDGTG